MQGSTTGSQLQEASLIIFNDNLAIEERLSAKDITANAKTLLDEALTRNKETSAVARYSVARRGALLGTCFPRNLSALSKKKKASLISTPSENQFAISCLSK